jgi:transposase
MHENLLVSVVNPYLMKKFGDNEMRKGKTDKKDALRIAIYVLEKSYALQQYTLTDQKYDDLKFLSRQYHQCVSMKIKARVQLSNLLDETMPGIQSLIHTKNTNPESSFLYKFIQKYKSFDDINRMSEQRFLSSYSKLAQSCNCRIIKVKALKIYEVSCNSNTTRGTDTSTLLAMKQCLDLLIQTEKASNQILSQMQSIAFTLPEFQVVLAMNGVGNKLAPRLIAEIGDIRRFHSAKALNAYAGNDAPPFQSGQYTGTQRHISKRGSAYLRKACYEVMQELMLHNPQGDAVYQFILKKESEGKAKRVAKMAGVNKFLHIYYARVMEIYR